MGGRRRVDHQGANVAQVGQLNVQLECVGEGLAGGAAALDDEAGHRPGAGGHVLGGVLGPRRAGQPGVVHPLHLIVGIEELDDRLGVGDVALHAQRQRLQALQHHEGVERRDRCAGVAQPLQACLEDVRAVAQRGPEREAVVALVGLVEPGELLGVTKIEAAAVDDDAADRGAVATDELGGRVHDDIGPVLQRAAQEGRGDRVVDDQRHARLVGGVGHGRDVEDVVARVADRLPVERLGVWLDRGLPGLDVAGVLDEGHLDAHLGQGVTEQVVGSAVQRGGGDDV